MGKEKKIIDVLTAFFISHKSDVKTFLKQIVNECPQGTRQHDPSLNDIINDFIKKYNHNKYLLISIIIINFQLKKNPKNTTSFIT